MLEYFSVKGYRNFVNETALDLSRLRDYRFNKDALGEGAIKCALMYGKNAVGKTNFGRAITDICIGMRNLPIDEDVAFLNTEGASRARFVYRFCFSGTEVEYIYEKQL